MARPDEESDSAADETLPDANPRERQQPSPLTPGMVLGGRYCLEALLGRGGSGVVFRGSDRVLGETIAIKILHPERALDRSWIKRLFREVKIARAIRHPNVCRVFELGEAEGHWFITMELASGTLRQRLEDAPERPWAERLEDARAVCNGLSAIHAVGIIHRDVTPQNVLCMPDGRLVISDFGLALVDKESTTMHGGTPNYMAPEVLRGDRSDQRSDVWQLGVVLHEILFGRRPVWEQKGERSVLQPPVVRDASVVVEEMGRLCADCLAFVPGQRPGSAVAVAGRLAAAEVARPRSWMFRRWMRVRAWARRRRRSLLAGLVVAVLAAGAVRSAQIARRPSLCRGASERTAAVWNPSIKSKIGAAFRATGKAYAADALSTVTRLLDDYVQRWTGMYTEACEATHVRGEQSADTLDLRMFCLRDRLDELAALAQAFSVADASAVGHAATAASGIRPLDHCADLGALRSGVKPPRDKVLREKVDRLSLQLTRARAAFETAAWADAKQRTMSVVSEARDLGYQPLLGRGLLLAGHLRAELDEVGSSEKLLEEAVFVASAVGDDETVAAAGSMLTHLAGHDRGRFEVAETWARLARAALQRMGGNPRLEGWLANDVGALRFAQERYEEAVASLQLSTALKTKALGPDHVDVGLSLSNAANALRELGRYEEALAAVERSIAISISQLGPEHPWVARGICIRGEVLLGLMRVSEARAELNRALAILERDPQENGAGIGMVLTALGACDLAEGKTDKALERLEQALTLRQSLETGGSLVGEVPFMLAKALWESGRGRPRAIRLAVQARDEYRRFSRIKKAAQVDAWLAAHR